MKDLRALAKLGVERARRLVTEAREQRVLLAEQRVLRQEERRIPVRPYGCVKVSARSSLPALKRCPHCDSKNVEAMKPRPNERESTLAWYQCRDCERMWSVPKHALLGRKKR